MQSSVYTECNFHSYVPMYVRVATYVRMSLAKGKSVAVARNPFVIIFIIVHKDKVTVCPLPS